MRIVVTGGGTGGHTSPGRALIEELRRRDPGLLAYWIGQRKKPEERTAKALGIGFQAVTASPWPRKRSLAQVVALIRVALGTLHALGYLSRVRPDVVLGVGGYVSLPAIVAARVLRIPLVIHEQNRLLGMANRVALRWAERAYLSYADTTGMPETFAKGGRSVVAGNPVRAGFMTPPSREEACTHFGLDPARPVILVVGGSQGARSINEAVAAVLEAQGSAAWQWIWMTGESGYATANAVFGQQKAHGQVLRYIDDMPAACAAANLVVARSGASTCAELAAMGKPAIFVPYPFAAEGHQLENARVFETAGAAVIIADEALDGPVLGATLDGLLRDRNRLAGMADAARTLATGDAAERIAEDLLEHLFSA